MNDPLVYPIAETFIPYRSPILLTGLRARACEPEQANAMALDSSYNGTTKGYEIGQQLRAQKLPCA